jgi:hypothetical protein
LPLLAVAVVLWSGLGPALTVEAKVDRIGVAPVDLTLSEPSGTGIFTITLTGAPKAPVTIPLSTSNGQCAVAVDQVVVDMANWKTGVPVTVSAVDDAIVDGTQTCVVQTAAASSADPKYNDVNPDDVTVSVLDDDVACIIVSPTIVIVDEPNSPAHFTIRLCSQPTSGVWIALSTSMTRCSVAPIYAWLTTANWSNGITVTVALVEDAILDATRVCVVQTQPSVSEDPNYDGIDPADVQVIWRNFNPVARIYVPLVARNWMPVTWEPPIGPIQSGVTYCVTSSDAADPEDIFYFGMPAAHTVELWLTGIPAGQDYNVVLRDDGPDYTPVGYSGNPGNAPEHILTGVLPPGRYYIQVLRNSPGGSSQAYCLRVVYEQRLAALVTSPCTRQ